MRFSDWSSDVCSSDLTSLTAATLPEGQPHPALYDALSALLDAIAVAPSARQWAAALARYELLLLAELGFGLALDACAATGGTEDLAFVSPRSGAAVSSAAAEGYETRLFGLPHFLRGAAADTGRDHLLECLAVTGPLVGPELFGGVIARLI